MQKEVYLRFIDYWKAFSKVRDNVLLELLCNLDIPKKDISIISVA